MAIENENSGTIKSLMEVGGAKARMEDSVLISTNADQISKIVTDPKESKEVFDAIIALSNFIMKYQNTLAEKPQED